MGYKTQKSSEATEIKDGQELGGDPGTLKSDHDFVYAADNLIARHTAKDSVFCDLFQDKKYLLQLYQALHPEDTETTEEDLTDVTIRNVLTDGIYNDVGFRNKDKVVILAEAQSTWSMNILIRMLLYLAETYHSYFRRQDADLYSSTKVFMPTAELYVIFTGNRASKPEYISLSQEFFHGKECFIEIKAKVLYGDHGNDIISQYVTFSKVYTEQVKKHGYTREAVLETIRICKDKDVLSEYLRNREGEAISIMMELFDEEYIQRAYHKRLRREIKAEAIEEAKAEVVKEITESVAKEVIKEVTESVTKEVTESVTKEVTESVTKEVTESVTKEVTESVTKEVTESMTRRAAEKDRRSARKLYQKGVSVQDIAEVSEVPVETVKQWLDL